MQKKLENEIRELGNLIEVEPKNMNERAKQTKKEQLESMVEDHGARAKMQALEDYSINLRTETFQLKHRSNLYEMEKFKSDPEYDFFKDCIAEMKEIKQLQQQLDIAHEGVAQVYSIDEFSARDQVNFDQGVLRAVTQRLPKGKLDIESLAAQAQQDDESFPQV